MSDLRRATLAALQRSTGGGTLVYRAASAPWNRPGMGTVPLWLQIARELRDDGRTIRGAIELRNRIIGDGGDERSSRRDRYRRGLLVLAREGAVARRGTNHLVVVVDLDRVAELLAEDPDAVTFRHSRRVVDGAADRG